MSECVARQWRVRGHTLDVTHAVVMGVVNVTPDSFFAGSRCPQHDDAIACARRHVDEGAAMVDIGGESTRPGADAVPLEEELRRVVPVVKRLVQDGVIVSIDTRKSAVARAALEAGAHIINDIGGLRDMSIAELAHEFETGLVLMHMHGEPATMQDDPLEGDVVCDVVRTFFTERLALAQAMGVPADAVVLDPGIGFGKTYAANERLINRLGEFACHGRPLLVGASRKRFIGARTGRADSERLAGTLGVHVMAVARGARIIRTHDVAATRDALLMTDAILSA